MKSIFRRGGYDYRAFIYLAPWLIGLAVFQLYPILASLVYSVTDLRLLRTPAFVGLRNYITMFTSDRLFFQSLKVTAIYAVMAVPGRILFALLVAYLLTLRVRLLGLFRTIFYLPSILGGSVVIAILWRYLFMREGVFNLALGAVGIPAQDWLGSPSLALGTISVLPIWQFGSSMVLFLAALKQVPAELYEAARIDGASPVRCFVSVTLPMITPILLFNLIMQTINAFQEFTAAFVITGGGPLYSTYLYGLKIYDEGFQYFKMGYASALSWVLFFIILCLTALIFRSSASWAHYEYDRV